MYSPPPPQMGGVVSLFITFRSNIVFLLQYVLVDEFLKNTFLALTCHKRQMLGCWGIETVRLLN